MAAVAAINDTTNTQSWASAMAPRVLHPKRISAPPVRIKQNAVFGAIALAFKVPGAASRDAKITRSMPVSVPAIKSANLIVPIAMTIAPTAIRMILNDRSAPRPGRHNIKPMMAKLAAVVGFIAVIVTTSRFSVSLPLAQPVRTKPAITTAVNPARREKSGVDRPRRRQPAPSAKIPLSLDRRYLQTL